MTNPADVRYLSQVRKYLFCSHKDKKRLTEKCRTFLDSYRLENPEAVYDDIVANFGPPPEFAGVLTSEVCPDMPQDVQAQYIKRQKFWLRLAVCLAILAIAAFVWYAIWVANHDITYIVKTVTVTNTGLID